MPSIGEIVGPFMERAMKQISFGSPRAVTGFGRMFRTPQSEAFGAALARKNPMKLLDINKSVPRLGRLRESRYAAGDITGAFRASNAKQIANETVGGGLKHLYPDLAPQSGLAVSPQAMSEGLNRIKSMRKLGFSKHA